MHVLTIIISNYIAYILFSRSLKVLFGLVWILLKKWCVKLLRYASAKMMNLSGGTISTAVNDGC